MAKRRKNGADRGALKTYKSYVFIDKDPIIDAIRTARSDSGMSFKDTSISSNVSETTLRNWEQGQTRRPQFATVVAVIRVLGATGVSFDGRGHPHLMQPARSSALYKLPKAIREKLEVY